MGVMMVIQLPGAGLVALMSRMTDERHVGAAMSERGGSRGRTGSEKPANDRTKLTLPERKPRSRLDLSKQDRDIAASSEQQTKSTRFYEHTRSDL